MDVFGSISDIIGTCLRHLRFILDLFRKQGLRQASEAEP
jgi:hypothetical protein